MTISELYENIISLLFLLFIRFTTLELRIQDPQMKKKTRKGEDKKSISFSKP